MEKKLNYIIYDVPGAASVMIRINVALLSIKLDSISSDHKPPSLPPPMEKLIFIKCKLFIVAPRPIFVYCQTPIAHHESALLVHKSERCVPMSHRVTFAFIQTDKSASSLKPQRWVGCFWRNLICCIGMFSGSKPLRGGSRVATH